MITYHEAYVLRHIEKWDLVISDVEYINANYDRSACSSDFNTFWNSFYAELSGGGWLNMPYVDGMGMNLGISVEVFDNEAMEWDVAHHADWRWVPALAAIGITLP